MDVSPVAQGPYFQKTKHPQPLKSTSFSDRSLSTSSESPFKVGSPFGSKWSSPKSIVVSPPSLISTAASAKSFADYRSPTFDSASTPISATDSERFARIRQPSRRSNSNGSILAGALGDGGSSAGRTKRGASYDQGIFTTESDLDSDFPSEETGGMRQLHLDDPSTPSIDVQSPNSRLGMKRRASSPPPELTHDSKSPLQTVGGTSSDLYQRRTSGHLSANRASPVHPHSATHGSVSPASSGGPPNGSYASSAGLSVGGNSGSITSISSHERSPGGISPLSEQHESRDSQYVNTAPFDPTFQNSTPLPLQHLNSDIIAARKMSSDNANHSKHSNAPQLQANIHMCSCCPKKPKKFDTIEELRYVVLYPHSFVISDRFAPVVNTKVRSNTSVNGVTIVSRIRTKPSATRTHYTFAATHGAVLPLTGIFKLHSTLAMPSRRTPMRVTLFHSNQMFRLKRMSADIADYNSPTFQPKIGRRGALILQTPTSLANAIKARNFTAPIISDNTSNTAMRAQAASGRTCSRTPA
ncbi:hypothetical protein MMC19_006639 [Ptychographa xylographoides]|nr:hypothetical protein [Ptychographa xylographoides]